MNALPYFLSASLFLLLFYSCYHMMLRRNTFFVLNRTYLLVSVVVSLVLPLISLPVEWFMGSSTPSAIRTVTLPTFSVSTDSGHETSTLTSAQWFWLIYSLGVVIMLIRLAVNLRAVFQLIRSGTAEQRQGYVLVRLSESPNPNDTHPSFSFGRYLVLNQTDALAEPDALMRHEQAHIRQRHTADILFVEVVRAALWFNPVLWMFKRALQEVHEFLADRAASNKVAVEPAAYAHQLVAYALHVAPTALTTPFVSVSTLKQRIVMLQKPQSRRRALLGYALVLPLAGALTLCTQPDRDLSKTDVAQATDRANARKPAKVEGKVFTVVQNQPEFSGGMKDLGEYLSTNLKYPAAAQKANASGKVFVNFIVTKDGSITDVNVLKGIGFGADEEAIRVVSQMPRWKPGRQNGQAVNVRYNLPINFQMEETANPGLGKVSPPPPPPAPIPAPDASALEEVKFFTINGKEATKKEVEALSPDKIIRVDVNKEQGTVAVTVKK